MSAIQTLTAYEAGYGTANRFIATWAGRFWDVRLDWSDVATRHTRIAHPEGADSLFSSDRWLSAQIANTAGGVFSVFANGADTPVRFTGHHLESARCTIAPDYLELVGGVANAPDFDATRLRGLTAFKNRLWWHESSGAQLWYGTLYAPGGDLYPFNVGASAGESGDIASLAKLSRDGGSGPDDYLVILFRSGTALVYAGTDPNDDANFGLVGRFFVGEPLGDRPLVEWGAELLAITKRGILPISAVITGKPLNDAAYYTDALRGLWPELVQQYGDLVGWEGVIAPDGNSLIVNVPDYGNADGLGSGHQLIMNLVYGVWAEYRGWTAGTWATFEGELFYAHASVPAVYAADDPSQADDAGEPIHFLYQGAFSYLPNPARPGYSEGGEGVQKRVHAMLSELDVGAGGADLEIGIVTDFQDRTAAGITTRFGVAADTHSSRRRSVLRRGTRGYAISPVLRSGQGDADRHGPLTFYNLLIAYGLARKV